MSISTFNPQTGQSDFTNLRYAPVLDAIVQFENKILLLKRSQQVGYYPGYWHCVSGFLDDHKTLEEKVYQELAEELGLERAAVISITKGDIFEDEDPEHQKVWIVHPVLVEVNTDTIKTDWESESCQWLEPDAAYGQKLVPGFDTVLARFFPHEEKR